MKTDNPTESTKRPEGRAILVCPHCRSNRAAVVNTSPLRAQCFDCDTTYPVDATARMDTARQKITPRNRKIKADYRAEIEPAPPPNLPFLQKAVDSALSAGACGIRQSQRLAIDAARRYMDDLVDYWRRDTPYLQDCELSVRGADRARVRYARRWRPKFLAFLSVSDSPYLAARSAHVDTNTIYNHRQRDPEFAQQWADACRIAIDLLEARVFQRAVEGDLEPIHYMGVVVDYVRKFDSKLQIELLRAKRPDTFKTPGGTNVNVGTRGDVFVLTEDQRHELQRMHREYLLNSPLPTRDTTGDSPRELGDAKIAECASTTPTTCDENTPADDKNSSP